MNMMGLRFTGLKSRRSMVEGPQTSLIMMVQFQSRSVESKRSGRTSFTNVTSLSSSSCSSDYEACAP